MDVSNDHLKDLLKRTDEAFKALLKEPGSAELNLAYDQAKEELDKYIAAIRTTLSHRFTPR